VDVELSREVGWATIREKVRLGELDAAQAPAPMLWAMQLGIGCPPCPVLSAFVLNQNGNALTLSRSLGPGARTSAGLREIVRARREGQPLTIGAVFPFSSHYLLIREWMRKSGLAADKDVRIAIIPPAQMFRNLVAGTIDGYVAGEPWNSLAVSENAGWCPLWSAALGAPQAEKVLLVTRRFAESRAAEHAAILAALSESARWCDVPANRAPLAKLLAGPRYVSLPERLIAPTLLGRFDSGNGAESVPDFHIFSRDDANRPDLAKAAELQGALQSAGLIPRDLEAGLARGLFREDLYSGAVEQKPARRKSRAK
jgi:ABC-type nitrate/sulfonate/bicarbonate transport system substrate-binding protein